MPPINRNCCHCLARSTVHFNAICERFGPCETTFDITEPKELNDAKLSHACSLHTASASTSSSNSSLRRRRLVEIAEEEEEEHRETKRQSILEEADDETRPGEIDQDQPRPRTPITGPPVTLDSNLASSPQASQFAGTVEPPSFTGAPRPASPAKSFDDARRPSSQSSRQDSYSHSSYLHSKPRVKLGPRPSVDPSGRPRSSAGNIVRPVASMPAGLKLALNKGVKKGKHDDSSSVISEEPSDDTFLAPSLSIPEDAPRPHTSGGRPTTSSGASVKSLPAVTTPAKLTPEKLRLMKAMQLREKKKRESEMQATPVPSVQITTTSPAAQANDNEPHPPTTETEAQDTMLRPADTECEPPASDRVSKADSGIDVASSAPTDHGSVHTQTDSRPASPVDAPSEVDDSTQASSVSESTDETAHPRPENKEAAGEQETTSPGQEPTVDISSSSAEVEETSSALGQEAHEVGPSQHGSVYEQDPAEADETRDDQDANKAVEKLAPVVEEETIPSESSLNIPTSKFAAKVASGQAATDPMAFRDTDPPNVTSVPGKIDEVEPVPVGPPERTEDGPAASPTKWNLPISKYSTHDSTKCLAPSPILENVAHSTTSPNGQHDLADAATKMDDEIASGETGRSDTKRRPDPILTGSGLPDKEVTRGDDKKPADDAQSTIVEDAQSTTVTSPISPVTTIPPAQPTEQSTPRILRTVSSPAGSPRTNAGDPPHTSRSVSGSAFQNRMSQPPGPGHLTPRNSVKVGTGISSRIKAFEQIAAKSGPPAPIALPVSKDRPSSAFFSVRQNSIREGARSPSVLDRTNSIYRGRTPTPNESLDGSPETVRSSGRERSGSVASRMSVFEGGNAPRGRPETVSVTARIVRDPGQHYPRPPSQVDFSDYSLDFRQSPLVVDHQRVLEEREEAPVPAADAPPVPTPLVHAGEPRRSLQERRLSKDTKASSVDDPLHRPGQRTSLTMARDFIRESMVGKDNGSAGRQPPVQIHQPTSLMSRLSISTHRRSVTQDTALLSPTSAGEKSESGDEKKEGNRASRLMRRLSSTFSPKKSGPAATSPILPEESNEPENAVPVQSMATPVAPAAGSMVTYMGDVNVQFPENLLWKRRSMTLDPNGFLHLTPAQGAVSARERQSKKFHMSEFKNPYAPEIEVQELPNSVCMDFLSGSGLQFAFQDRAGQLNGLQSKPDPSVVLQTKPQADHFT